MSPALWKSILKSSLSSSKLTRFAMCNNLWVAIEQMVKVRQRRWLRSTIVATLAMKRSYSTGWSASCPALFRFSSVKDSWWSWRIHSWDRCCRRETRLSHRSSLIFRLKKNGCCNHGSWRNRCSRRVFRLWEKICKGWRRTLSAFLIS